MFVWNPKDAFFSFFPTGAYDSGFARMASPTSYVHAGIPPMLIISGAQDTCVPVGQASVFADNLKAAGVDVTLVIEPDQGHSLNDKVTRAESIDFLKRILEKLPSSR
jgi:dipeptidyl aminopeptidase/acylaminoacyl peptidase